MIVCVVGGVASLIAAVAALRRGDATTGGPPPSRGRAVSAVAATAGVLVGAFAVQFRDVQWTVSDGPGHLSSYAIAGLGVVFVLGPCVCLLVTTTAAARPALIRAALVLVGIALGTALRHDASLSLWRGEQVGAAAFCLPGALIALVVGHVLRRLRRATTVDRDDRPPRRAE